MIRKVHYKDSDLVPVAMVGLAPSVVVAPASSPYSSLKDFVEASKQGHGLHFATAGTGSTPHFVEGILTTTYGAKLDLIPYKSGSESVSAVIGNQVDATSEASIVVLPMIRSGKLKALACTWSERIKAYPELSTAAEQGFPEIKIAHWAGVHAPKGTPDAILDKVAGAVDAAMKDPANVKRLTELGIEPVGGTRADFIRFCDEERARLGAVVKATGMRQEDRGATLRDSAAKARAHDPGFFTQSILIWTDATMPAHFFSSPSMKAFSAAGVLVLGMAPSPWKRCCNSGDAMACPSAAFSLSITACGVPLGASSAFHVLIS